MKTCKTCKHWKETETEYIDFTAGKCTKAKLFWDYTKWNDDYTRRTLSAEAKNELSFVQDDSDYYAELITLPEFGCVQHA